MRKDRDLLVDCLGRLNRLGLPYMLTGSMASNYWGTPRTTHDIDFVLALKPDDVNRFVAAFDGPFFLQPESVRNAFVPPYQFNAIDEQSALKVDFWILRDHPFERAMFSRRMSATLFGMPATIATVEDVILHKLYWNSITPSLRQLDDAAGVYRVQAGSLDREYMRHWASSLGVVKELEDLESGRIGPKST